MCKPLLTNWDLRGSAYGLLVYAARPKQSTFVYFARILYTVCLKHLTLNTTENMLQPCTYTESDCQKRRSAAFLPISMFYKRSTRLVNFDIPKYNAVDCHLLLNLCHLLSHWLATRSSSTNEGSTIVLSAAAAGHAYNSQVKRSLSLAHLSSHRICYQVIRA